MKNLIILIFALFISTVGISQSSVLSPKEIAKKEMQKIEKALSRTGEDFKLTAEQNEKISPLLLKKAYEVSKIQSSQVENDQLTSMLTKVNEKYSKQIVALLSDKQQAVFKRMRK